MDFNNESTIGTAAIDITRVILLQYRYDTRDAYENYIKSEESGTEGNISIVKARLITWFLEMRAMLKRKMTKDDFNTLESNLDSAADKKTILSIICLLDEELDKIRLTRIDVRDDYDSKQVEKENRMKKL